MEYSEKLKSAVLYIGIFFFLIYKVGFVAYSMFMREQPVEVDDSYVYMWKAVNMENCFRNDCAVHNDLREQLFIPSESLQHERILKRNVAMHFLVYTPLNSIAIVLFHKIGFDWINAYRILLLCGIVFICMSIVYWMYVLWGKIATGVAMLLTGPIMFQAQGFHTIVPSNIAMGIGVLMWAIICQKEDKTIFCLPILSIVAIMTHPIGKIYTCVAMGLYVLIIGRNINYKNIISLIVTIGILAAATMIPHFVDRPLMADSRSTTYFGISWINGIANNFSAAFGNLGSPRFNRNAVIFITGFVAFLVAVVLPENRPKKRQIVATGFMLIALTISSLFYVIRLPAELFHRIWIPVFIFFAGAIASVFAVFAEQSINYIKNINKEGCITKRRLPFCSLNIYQKAIVICISFFLCGSVGYQILFGTRIFFNHLEHRIKRHPFVLDVKQPNKLLAFAPPDSRILYIDEIPMLFYLVNGAHIFGAVYYPAIEKSRIADKWTEKINFIVGWNDPYLLLTRGRERIRLADIDTINYESENTVKLHEMELFISNPGEAFYLNMYTKSKYKTDPAAPFYRLPVPAKHDGWLSFKDIVLDSSFYSLHIVPEDVNEKASLIGFRFSENNPLIMWPWKQKAKIGITYLDGENTIAKFNLTEYIATYQFQTNYNNHNQISVVADTGSLLLLKIDI